MKRIVFSLVALLTGCVVQSFHPFYLDKSLVLPPGVTGSWQLQMDYGNDVSTNNITPWVFTGSAATNVSLVAFDKDNLGAEFAARFFKLGNDLFLDVSPQKLNEGTKLNGYWEWTTRAVHAVCKVEMSDELMTLKLLDYDWLKEKLKKRKVSLPHLGPFDEMPLLTATPKQWETLLRKYAKDAGAFPSQHAFVLKRLPVK
jgi:hypothetical protein